MATQLAQVTVTRMEAGLGWHVACATCGWKAVRGYRASADIAAHRHQAAHAAASAEPEGLP